MLNRGFWLSVLLSAMVGAFAVPASAQTSYETPPEDIDGVETPTASETDTIVVQGSRQRGAVLGDIPPEITLDETEIESYGVGNLQELLAELAAETGSSRGRGDGGPVVLLNGRRISGFREIGRYPSEALERVEILPEEVALQYGYRADQRVVNFVLKDSFTALTTEFEVSGPPAGGRVSTEYEAGYLVLAGENRWNLSAELELDPPLLESERNIIATSLDFPFDSIGNISAPVFGDEIDADLSTLAGELVTVAAVPEGIANPELADFALGANEARMTDEARFRTLRPEEQSIELDAGVTRGLNDVWAATLSAGLDLEESESLRGLADVTLDVPASSSFNPFAEDITLYRYAESLGALTRQTDTVSGNLSLTANGQRARWNTTITANAEFSDESTETDLSADSASLQALIASCDPAVNPYTTDLGTGFLTDTSETFATTYETTIVAAGPLYDLDAGEIRTTLAAEARSRRLETEDVVSGIKTENTLSRDSFILRGNLDLPLLNAEDEEKWGVGDFRLNLNLALDELSDFGTLTTVGYGFRWSPHKKWRLIGSVTEEDGAPSISQLGNPTTVTENVRVFDFVSGETVEVTQSTGGNPDLMADSRRVMKLGLNWKPFDETNLTIRADYTDNQIDNPIASFPSATAEIQAAFPERFIRNDAGTLVFVDTTPINFAESQRRDLRTGLVWSKRLGRSSSRGRGPSRGEQRPAEGRRPSQAERPSPGQPPTSSPAGAQPEPSGSGQGRPPNQAAGGGRPRGGGGMRPQRPGNIRISLFHTYAFEDRILIRDGVEELDLLGGSAVGSNGGEPEHKVSLRANIFNKGVGMAMNAEWQSETEVRDPDGNTSNDLFFSDLATVNVRLFTDLTQRKKLMERYPFLKNTRVSLFSRNIFDERQEVRDGTGEEPLQYQPDLIDPVGRTVGVQLRKTF